MNYKLANLYLEAASDVVESGGVVTALRSAEIAGALALDAISVPGVQKKDKKVPAEDRVLTKFVPAIAKALSGAAAFAAFWNGESNSIAVLDSLLQKTDVLSKFGIAATQAQYGKLATLVGKAIR